MTSSRVKRKLKSWLSRHFRRIVLWATCDFITVIFAYLLAFAVRTVTAPLSPFVEGLWFILLAAIVTLIANYSAGVYYRIWSRTSGHDVRILVGASGVATLVILVLDIGFLGSQPLPVSVVLLGGGIALVGAVGLRYRSRLISGFSWRWRAVWRQEFPPEKSTTRVLLIGAGESGQAMAWRLKHRLNHRVGHYTVVGFVDDAPEKRGMYVEGCPVLGDRTEIPSLVEAYKIDLIILSVHNISGPDFRDVLNYCEHTGARIKIAPDLMDMMTSSKGVPLLRDVKAEDFLGRQPIGRHEAVDLGLITERVVLVTGAAGSIGSELCRQLLDYAPVKLIAVDNNESGLYDLSVDLHARLAASSSQIEIVPSLVDITNRPAIEDVFAIHRPQVVFHAAAYKHVPMLEQFPDEAVRVNIGGTLELSYLAHRFHIERFVLISTDKAVQPTSVMGASKRICEMIMLAQANTNSTLFTSVRFGNVLGSRGSVVPTFNRQIDAGGPVTVTDKDMRRYFMSIPEAVNLVLHAACLTQGNDLFMLKMGELMRIVDLAERMIRMRGLRPYQDVPIHFTGVRPGEKLYEELQEDSERSLETLHPNVVQLVKDSDESLQSGEVLAAIEHLVSEGLQGDQAALDQLKALILTNTPATMTV